MLPGEGENPGNGGRSHVQQHFQYTKHRVTIQPSANASLTQNTSSPWEFQAHFRTPENEMFPKCSPWDSSERLHPVPSTDHCIWGNPARLVWNHSAFTSLFPKQELSGFLLCAIMRAAALPAPDGRWKQYVKEHISTDFREM